MARAAATAASGAIRTRLFFTGISTRSEWDEIRRGTARSLCRSARVELARRHRRRVPRGVDARGPVAAGRGRLAREAHAGPPPDRALREPRDHTAVARPSDGR